MRSPILRAPLKLEYFRHHQIPPAVRGTGTTPVAAKGVDQIHTTTTPSSLIRFLPLVLNQQQQPRLVCFNLAQVTCAKLHGSQVSYLSCKKSRRYCGKRASTASMSLEKRLRRRPRGMVSKNSSDADMIPCSSR